VRELAARDDFLRELRLVRRLRRIATAAVDCSRVCS
jgi:hypothetical protein